MCFPIVGGPGFLQLEKNVEGSDERLARMQSPGIFGVDATEHAHIYM